MYYLFFFLFQVIHSSIYNNSLYYLDSNLVYNGYFDNPTVTANQTSDIYMPDEIGWNCTRKIQIANIPFSCASKNLTCNASFTQAVEWDTTQWTNESIWQNISIITQGQYYFRVIWMPAIINPIGKGFDLSFNSTPIVQVMANDALYEDHVVEMLMNLTVGVLDLDVVQTGNTNDYYSTYIGSIELNKLVQISPASTTTSPNYQTSALSAIFKEPLSTFSYIMLQNFTMFMNIIPGNRIFLETVTNFLLTFDRLQFYYLHEQNLTENSYVLLANAYALGVDRGSLTQRLIQNCEASICFGITETYMNLENALDHKVNYTSQHILNKNSKGLGFFANNLDFFFYELPAIIIFYLIFFFSFRILFNYRISKNIRKYAFYGILLPIVYEGNVQQFSFYFFTECMNLFSCNVIHKLANVYMIFFFFLLMVFSVGGLLFFTFNYGKLIKYFLEDSKFYNVKAVVFQSLQRSIYPLIFGACHAILLSNLFLQTIILFLVEFSYLTLKVIYLRSIIPRYKFKVLICALSSMLRLVFISTFYLYQKVDQSQLINSIHYELVYHYILFWLVELLHDCLVLVMDIKQAIFGFCKGCSPKSKFESNKIIQTEAENNNKIEIQRQKNISQNFKAQTNKTTKKKKKDQITFANDSKAIQFSEYNRLEVSKPTIKAQTFIQKIFNKKTKKAVSFEPNTLNFVKANKSQRS